MKKSILFCVLFVTSFGFSQSSHVNKKSGYSTTQKIVKIYTTADSSTYRLSLTGEAKFHGLAQPLENEVSIFVDPAKTYQTFLGIGAALTDASAETFAKLPKKHKLLFYKPILMLKTGLVIV